MSDERRHHLDKRAGALALLAERDPEDLLSTPQVAAWLGVSTQWLEIGRHRNYGPPYIKVSTRRVRYNRGAVAAWLNDRVRSSTQGDPTATGGRPRTVAP